jgi:hypothetical protein
MVPGPVAKTADNSKEMVWPAGATAGGAGAPAAIWGWWTCPCPSTIENAPASTGTTPAGSARVTVKVVDVVGGGGVRPSAGTAGPTTVMSTWPAWRVAAMVSPSIPSLGSVALALTIRLTGMVDLGRKPGRPP